MEISPDRLIDVALDNVKRKLAAAVSLGESISPTALEKLPGALREAVDTLRRKGIPNVRGEDILAEVRTELTARLAGSLKAGELFQTELSPEIVKWLAGTSLAVPIANRIRPSGRRQMAGGAAAVAAMGPVAILAKPLKENGPVGIIARPPGDNGPVGIITRPPGESGPVGIIARPPGDNGPISILAKPPSDGSNGGPRKGHSRLRWLLPVGIAVVVIFLLGMLAGSINRRTGPVATETIRLVAGVSERTYTTTPSEISGLSMTKTSTDTATPTSTPTDTLTATPYWTETPTATMPSASFFQMIVEPKHIYYRGTGCGEKQARFQVKVAEPVKVAGVWFFIRLRAKSGDDATPWGEALVMTSTGSGGYSYLLYSESIPDFNKYPEAWVQYQFVAYDSLFARVSTSDVFWDVDLSACGK